MWALRGVSSAGLERLPVTQKVEGSSPLHPARDLYRRFIGGILKFWPHRLMVRTPPFQGENPGSNPSGAAKIQKSGKTRFFNFAMHPTKDCARAPQVRMANTQTNN